MTVELTTAHCDLLGLLAHQPNVGFATIERNETVRSVTQSARDLLFGQRDFNPQGRLLTEVEGPDVAGEISTCIATVCDNETSIRYQQVRLGRLLTMTLWPLRDETSALETPVDSVIAMLTCAADTSAPGMVDVLKLTNTESREDRAESTQTKMVTSKFATWGPLDTITPRERDVLVWIGRGLSQKEIAEQMGVSAKTVETHRMRLGKKLHVKSASQLVRIACHSGIGPEHTSLKAQQGAAWLAVDANDVFEIDPPMPVGAPITTEVTTASTPRADAPPTAQQFAGLSST